MDIKSMTLPELQEEMAAIGEKSFRAKQLYEWIHVRQARSFDEMTNLSVALRERCRERYDLTTLRQAGFQVLPRMPILSVPNSDSHDFCCPF